MEMRFRYRFEAAHRFTQATSASCMTPHGHTWHATLHLQSLRTLNNEGMVIEFSKAKSIWKSLITECFDHSYMCHYQDKLTEALRMIHPEARLIPFPGDPTTETIALLLFAKMDMIIQSAGLQTDVQVSGMTIEETPTNSIFCSRDFFADNLKQFKNFSGWWTSLDPLDRSIKYDSSITN